MKRFYLFLPFVLSTFSLECIASLEGSQCIFSAHESTNTRWAEQSAKQAAGLVLVIKAIKDFFGQSKQTYDQQSHASQRNVDRYESWTAQDFNSYFFQSSDSQSCRRQLGDYFEIMRNYSLHRYKGFRDFISGLPGFEQFHDELTERLQTKSFCTELHNRFGCDVVAQLKSLYPKCTRVIPHEPPSDPVSAQFRPDRDIIERCMHNNADALQKQCEQVPVNDNHKKRIQNRLNGFKAYQAAPRYERKTYTVAMHTRQLIKDYELDIDAFTACFGNQLQHVVHQELLEILEQVSVASLTNQQKNMVCYIASFAQTGATYNHAGRVQEAITFADCCWAFWDYTTAIVQGIGRGFYTLASPVLHPIETTQNIKSLILWSGRCLVNAMAMAGEVQTLNEIGELHRFDPNLYFYEYQDALVQDLCLVTDAIKAHWHDFLDAPLREKVKYTAQFLTEIVVPIKCAGPAHNMFKRSARATKGCVQYARKVGTKQAQKLKRYLIEKMPELPIAQEAARLCRMAGECAKDLAIAGESSSFLAHYNSMLQREIAALQKIFHGVRKCGFGPASKRYVKCAFKHILGIEETKRGWSGFHHDFLNQLEKAGEVKLINKVMGKHGTYAAKVCYKAKTYDKTFFPSHWLREEVVAKIYEAYDCAVKNGKYFLDNNGKYILKGFTQEGIEIKMYMTQKGVITSAYPII